MSKSLKDRFAMLEEDLDELEIPEDGIELDGETKQEIDEFLHKCGRCGDWMEEVRFCCSDCETDNFSSRTDTHQEGPADPDPDPEPAVSDTKIYLMETDGYTKIGISTEPKRRRETIQSHTPKPVTIITTIESPTPKRTEGVLHRAFKEYQTTTAREWFDLSDRISGELIGIDVLDQYEAREKFLQPSFQSN